MTRYTPQSILLFEVENAQLVKVQGGMTHFSSREHLPYTGTRWNGTQLTPRILKLHAVIGWHDTHTHTHTHTHDIRNYLRMFSFLLYWLWFSLSFVLFFYILYVVTHTYISDIRNYLRMFSFPLYWLSFSLSLVLFFCILYVVTHTHSRAFRAGADIPTSEII